MLLRSLIASLLLHLLFLFGLRVMDLPQVPINASPSPMLEAILLRVAAPAVLPHPVVERLAPKESKVRPERIALPARKSARSEAPVLAANASSTAALPAAPSVKSDEGSVSVVPTVAASPVEVIDPDGLRLYRLALAKEARRYKRYPALARERGWEGVVVVAISIPLPGALPRVFLGKSSGHEILDRQALEMIEQAVLAAALPESLRGKVVSVSLPVRYALDE